MESFLSIRTLRAEVGSLAAAAEATTFDCGGAELAGG